MGKTLYTVTIRTRCRACAMTLAGAAPRLGTVNAVFVSEPPRGPEGHPLYIYANSPVLQSTDGSPLG